MNPDPLAALRPLHLPEPVGWWPPAPLWWLLAVLLLAATALALRALWRHYRRNRYRRAALRALEAAWQESERGGAARLFAARASALLRRAALARYGHARVAALTGRAWLEFLDGSARMQGFAEGPGAALAVAAYDPSAHCDAVALARLCRAWLRRHR